MYTGHYNKYVCSNIYLTSECLFVSTLKCFWAMEKILYKLTILYSSIIRCAQAYVYAVQGAIRSGNTQTLQIIVGLHCHLGGVKLIEDCVASMSTYHSLSARVLG